MLGASVRRSASRVSSTSMTSTGQRPTTVLAQRTPPMPRPQKPKKPEGLSATRVAVAGMWGFAGRVLMLLGNLLATPFTIRMLGPGNYGLWTILQTCITWAVTADVGMGPASTKVGSERYAHKDGVGESAVVWTAVAIMTVTTSIVALAISIPAVSVLHLLGVHGRMVIVGVVALRISCGIFILQALANVVNTPLQVRLQWFGQSIIATTAALTASVGIPVAILLFGGGIITASLVSVASSAFLALGTLFLSIRTQPRLRYITFDKAIALQMLSYGGVLTISGILSLPLGAAERFFLSSNHSPTVVGYWSVAVTLATTLVVIPEQFLAPLLPALTRLHALGRFDELRALYRKSLVGMFLVLTPPAILLAVIAEPFLTLWAGPQYGHYSTVPFLIAVPGVWATCLARVPVSYLLASGRTTLFAKIQLYELVPYVVGSWVLTAKFGVLGAALIWSGRLVIETIIIFAVVRVTASLPTSPLPTRRFNSVMAQLILCAGAGIAIIISHGIVVRLCWVAGLGLIYLITLWRLVLAPGERQGLLFLADEALRRGSRPRHTRRVSWD
jgi:O-antigen/teichoic acid export membrane protein